MDKRKLVIAVATIIALLGVSLALYPSLNRVGMVASVGVLAADMWSWILRITGIVMALVAVAYVTRDIIREKARKLILPSADETDPAKLRNSLKRVAKRFPKVKSLIETSIQQLESIQLSLAKIDEIFRLNPELFIAGDDQFAYGTYQLRLEGVRREISRSLVVEIIYTAYNPGEDRVDTSDELMRVISKVNNVNQVRVNVAHKLETVTVETLAQSGGTIETDELQALLNQLTGTTKRGELA